MTPRTAETSAPVLDTIAERWSPRSFATDHSLPEGALRGALEAARWAPSASNTQPWRFIVARRGSKSFDLVRENLMGFNQAWAGAASALIVNIAETETAEGEERPWAVYDLGQAVAHFAVQAHSEGLYVHQMGGFDRDGIRAAFDLPERLQPISVAAVGQLADPAQLPEPLREREVAPRQRIELDELVIRND